jgi:hypothetical protein
VSEEVAREKASQCLRDTVSAMKQKLVTKEVEEVEGDIAHAEWKNEVAQTLVLTETARVRAKQTMLRHIPTTGRVVSMASQEYAPTNLNTIVMSDAVTPNIPMSTNFAVATFDKKRRYASAPDLFDKRRRSDPSHDYSSYYENTEQSEPLPDYILPDSSGRPLQGVHHRQKRRSSLSCFGNATTVNYPMRVNSDDEFGEEMLHNMTWDNTFWEPSCEDVTMSAPQSTEPKRFVTDDGALERLIDGWLGHCYGNG